MSCGKIIKVSGPLVVATGIPNARLFDVVLVSHQELLGEIIEIDGTRISIQVYEETSGIHLDEPVVSLYRPLSVELGPGLLSGMLDGIGRNLQIYARNEGNFLTRGAKIETLPRDIKWHFTPELTPDTAVSEGDIIGVVPEKNFRHLILVPPGVSGTLVSVSEGEYAVDETVAVIRTKRNESVAVTLLSTWPIRKPRPYLAKQLPEIPLCTGQRIIDTFFPIAKGGTACIPGPFGSGKTVVQHQLAKWSDSDIVVYIGCGERGNEMTDVLLEFPQIVDPKTGTPLMDKLVLIANTSNMPVAAREASIYTGMTIAEYFRDMGCNVSLMADSTSRWAEALREMSGRLEEMPGDEGYPAYLASRLAQVYERAGIVRCNGTPERQGCVTMIGAVSPAGGDLSEPVTQATLRIAKVFWALDAKLAYARHFPAIHWLNSYSLYQDEMDVFLKKYVHRNFAKNRKKAMSLLKEEQKLNEIVQLIGKDSLSDVDLLKLEAARMLREDFLQQNAFMEEDTFTSHQKQALMLAAIIEFYGDAKDVLMHDHVYIADILNAPGIQAIARMKFTKETDIEQIAQIIEMNKNDFAYLRDSLLEERAFERV